MKLVAPFDCVQIELNEQDQQVLKGLIELQEAIGDIKKRLGNKMDDQKICKIPWKKLKHIVMTGDRSCEFIKIPLDEHK